MNMTRKKLLALPRQRMLMELRKPFYSDAERIAVYNLRCRAEYQKRSVPFYMEGRGKRVLVTPPPWVDIK